MFLFQLDLEKCVTGFKLKGKVCYYYAIIFKKVNKWFWFFLSNMIHEDLKVCVTWLRRLKMGEGLYWYWLNTMKIEQICENMFKTYL